MSVDLIIALIGFATVTSVTPGPNNLMLLASGVNFGFRRTLPHMLGINVGFPLMILLIGLGLWQVFEAYPAVYSVLRWVGAAYMVYLAYKIAVSVPSGEGSAAGTPMSFLQAVLFQWVNPKGWIMAVTAIATYTTFSAYGWSVAAVALAFAIVGAPSSMTWTVFGSGLRRLLGEPRLRRAFNVVMAVLLIASLAPILMQ
jgi:threonine/homoserine/homoserine lactone efflux protein